MIEVGECVGDLDTLSDMVTGMVGLRGSDGESVPIPGTRVQFRAFKFDVSNLAVTGGEVTAYHWGPLPTSEIGSSRGQRISTG